MAADVMVADVMVAVDVGGTGIKAGLVARDGTVWLRRRCPTGADRGPAAVVATVLRVAGELAAAARADGRRPCGVGVVVPGVVDEDRGVLVWSANLGLRDEPLADRVSAELGLPAWLGHDVRAGGVAEARHGAGRGARHVLFVAVGTGIAAAQVVAGRAVAGAHGAAGELGHVVIRPDGPGCGCGGRGCLEAVASAAAIGRRYAELAGGPADAGRVAAGVAAGDPTAARVWREAVAALADGLVIGQALVDAELIVVGGGLAEAGETLLAPLRTAVKERLTFHREPALVPAALGDQAGCLGAGLVGFDHLEAAG
jgi:glucokinase